MKYLIFVTALLSSTWTLAENNFRISGFGSIVAGSVLDGNYHDPLASNPDVDCPCAVTDWANNGFYEGSSWTLKPDSKIGIQANYSVNDQLSFTAQAISRGVEPKPEMTWAYGSYKFNDQWQLDIGRKRLPLYYYSDFQDVGFAYPWITPPGELYGWETTNYNGGSLRFNNHWNNIHISSSLFGGRESVKDNPYGETWANYRVDTVWDNIIGADLELNRDWWTLRFVYIKADVEFSYPPDPEVEKEDLTTYGVAFNVDLGDWFILSEAGNNVREAVGGGRLKSPAYSLGVGYRFKEKWSAFISHGAYKEINEPSAADDEYWRFNTSTITLRYDIGYSSNIKIQFDLHNDDSRTYDSDYVNLTNEYTGNTQLLRVSYDFVF